MGILRADRITGLGGANAITGSVEFHGKQSKDDLQLLPSSDFNFGTGDYTIEAWVYPVEFGRSQMIFAVHNADSTAAAGKFYFRSTNKFTYWSEGFARITSSTTYTESKWYHVALVNNSGTQTIYVDGTSQGTATYGNGFGRDDFVVNIGRNATTSDQSWNGFISNIRVTKGTALYTSNFTPPTTKLTKRKDTVLLACNSASDVLNEETGKVIQSVTASTNNSGPVASRFTPNSPVGFSTTTDVGSQYGATFDGFTVFATSTYMVPPGGNTRERNRGRGVVSGGETPSRVNTITFTHIQSSGNFQDFGDLIGGDAGETRGVGSSTRGVFFTNHGGSSGQAEDLEFITFANQSNGTDFGDLPTDHPMRGSAGNETRGIFAGGYKLSLKNEIEFITIATTGNGTDFGNLTGTRNAVAGLASPTRALFGGGSNPSNINNIDIVTIATTGDASDFGDLTRTGKEMGGVASNTRGVFAGARINPSTASNVIDFVTIASAGNAIDFGDLTQIVASPASMTDSIRGLFAGGYTPTPSFTRFNSIDFINIATTGNASDFGDLTYAQNYGGGCSDSHGGL